LRNTAKLSDLKQPGLIRHPVCKPSFALVTAD